MQFPTRGPILITGAAGYIGSHTCKQFLEQGFSVVALDNLSTGTKSLVPKNVELYEVDCGDKVAVAPILQKHGIKTVVHFAAFVRVDESVEKPLLYYENNFVKTKNLVETCVKSGVENFIFSSTASVYGVPEKLPAREDSPTRPVSPYGTSKLMSEWMLRDVCAVTPLRYVALRYFNVAGASMDGSLGQISRYASHLIKVASETACGVRKALHIYGSDYPTTDGTGVRDYIHVEDLAAAHVDAVRYLQAGGSSRVLNCGYGKGYTVQEVVNHMKETTGIDFPVVVAARRAGDVPSLVAETSEIRRVLGWVPRFNDLTTICRTAYLWERKWRSSLPTTSPS